MFSGAVRFRCLALPFGCAFKWMANLQAALES